MKKFFAVLFSAFSLSVFAQTGTNLTLSETENLFLKNNLSLLAAKFNVDAAHAAVIQAKLWENPNFQVGFNAYNPDRKKYFDIGPNGEKSFSIEQLIHLGGKKHDEIALARSNQQVAEYELSDLLRNLTMADVEGPAQDGFNGEEEQMPAVQHGDR